MGLLRVDSSWRSLGMFLAGPSTKEIYSCQILVKQLRGTILAGVCSRLHDLVLHSPNYTRYCLFLCTRWRKPTSRNRVMCMFHSFVCAGTSSLLKVNESLLFVEKPLRFFLSIRSKRIESMIIPQSIISLHAPALLRHRQMHCKIFRPCINSSQFSHLVTSIIRGLIALFRDKERYRVSFLERERVSVSGLLHKSGHHVS